MLSKSLAAVAIAATMAVTFSARGFVDTAEAGFFDSVKDAGKAVGGAVADAGKAVGNGAKTAAEAVGSEAESFGRQVGRDVAHSAKRFGGGVKDFGKQVGKDIAHNAKRLPNPVGAGRAVRVAGSGVVHAITSDFNKGYDPAPQRKRRNHRR